MKLKTIVIIVIPIFLLVVIYLTTLEYVDDKLSKKKFSNIYDSCHKVWAARGLYEHRSTQNSIPSLQSAFSLGVKGVEIDTHFDIKTGRFIIVHDHPIKDKNGELTYPDKKGYLDTFISFFSSVQPSPYFWLDFKNLDKLDEVQTQQAIKRLWDIFGSSSLTKQMYIEGSSPWILEKYTNAGFNTILGIHPLYENRPFAGFVLNIYKMVFYFHNISAIAMPYGYADNPVYGKSIRKNLGQIPVFLFHVPDIEPLIKNLVDNPNVRVVLVGKDLSVNRYFINSCNQKSIKNIAISTNYK